MKDQNEDIQHYLPIPPPPPIGLFDLTPPIIQQYSYELFYQKKHLAMINGETQFDSTSKQVQNKCKNQFQKSQKTATQGQSKGYIQTRNVQICKKCQRCGHLIQISQMPTHLSFHAAIIIDRLLLGDKHCSMSKKQLIQRNKVTHIVNAASQLNNYFEGEGIQYCKLTLYDQMDEDVISQATRASQFIKKSLQDGGVVFVHCAMGKSRSVSAIIMYLMTYHKLSYQESLALIRASRPIAKPNLGYEKQLKKYFEAQISQK